MSNIKLLYGTTNKAKITVMENAVGDLGIEDYYDKNGIVIIEWADMIPDYLPEERLEIKFKIIYIINDTTFITELGQDRKIAALRFSKCVCLFY